MTKKILFIVTSHGELGESGRKTGVWLEELAAPYCVLRDAGFDVDIASIEGETAPVDPLSLDEPWLSEYGRRFLKERNGSESLEGVPGLKETADRDYAAVYLVGGAGAAWDFADNRHIATLLKNAVSAGKPVAAICHGVLGLLNEIDGEPLAKGIHVTCVSNAEEEAGGFKTLVPLLPQDALSAAGARVTCADPFEANVVVDGKFITGQNPASAAPLAETLRLNISE